MQEEEETRPSSAVIDARPPQTNGLQSDMESKQQGQKGGGNFAFSFLYKIVVFCVLLGSRLRDGAVALLVVHEREIVAHGIDLCDGAIKDSVIAELRRDERDPIDQENMLARTSCSALTRQWTTARQFFRIGTFALFVRNAMCSNGSL